MILNYDTLQAFRNARYTEDVIDKNDLIRERNLKYDGKEYHCWLVRKNRKDYLVLDADIKYLPLRIIDTITITEDKSISHFLRNSMSIGYTPEKHMSFRDLIDFFCLPQHTNKLHQKLNWIIALSSLCLRINVRISANMEFGKDSTYVTLSYLTIGLSVYDKPRTLPKLEFGLNNKTLMINELIPNNEEERQNISDFLLSLGSLNPVYVKKSRSYGGSGETYNINDFSLIICYNILSEIQHKHNFFDFSFNSTVVNRFIPFKLNGKLDIMQFSSQISYTAETDAVILKLARTIEYYKQNWKSELKDYYLNPSSLPLEGRMREMFIRICFFINLYSENIDEYQKLVDALLKCYNSYVGMVRGNALLKPSANVEVRKEYEVISDTEEIQNGTSQKPLDFIRACNDNGEVQIQEFLKHYTEYDLEVLLRKGDVYKTNPFMLKILE